MWGPQRILLASRRVAWPATRVLRPLPDFLIIGAQKAGTSSLYMWMSASTDFGKARRKEILYFTDNYHRGEGWYRSHFPMRRLRRPVITGEATTHLLFDPKVPARVAADLPAVKLIVLLRNPIDRAWSHYWHVRRSGREDQDFETALKLEDERLRQGNARLYSYRTRGLYEQQLRLWFSHVPRGRFLILRSEDMFAQPQEVFDQACDWIGIRRATVPARVWNRGGYQEAMQSSTREELEAFYAGHNERLARLLQDDRYLWHDDENRASTATA